MADESDDTGAGRVGAERGRASDTDQPDADADADAGVGRRDFLKLGGVAAVGAVAGAGAGAAVGGTVGHSLGFEEGLEDLVPLTARQEAGFDHLVVLMGENRSFDNLLGYLYTPDDLPDGETFEGLAFGDYANPAPDGSVVAAHVYEGATDEIMGRPNPDPGEEFPHVNTQIFDTVDPPSNAALFVEDMAAPYNTPPTDAAPTMSGFVHDYWINYMRLRKGEPPTPEATRQIMGSFSPQMLPVLSTLAENFAVFDNWFCAVPSQTFCNRSFFHASTSHGFVTNKHGGGYD